MGIISEHPEHSYCLAGIMTDVALQVDRCVRVNLVEIIKQVIHRYVDSTGDVARSIRVSAAYADDVGCHVIGNQCISNRQPSYYQLYRLNIPV